jgi:hypothetical protein
MWTFPKLLLSAMLCIEVGTAEEGGSVQPGSSV